MGLLSAAFTSRALRNVTASVKRVAAPCRGQACSAAAGRARGSAVRALAQRSATRASTTASAGRPAASDAASAASSGSRSISSARRSSTDAMSAQLPPQLVGDQADEGDGTLVAVRVGDRHRVERPSAVGEPSPSPRAGSRRTGTGPWLTSLAGRRCLCASPTLTIVHIHSHDKRVRGALHAATGRRLSIEARGRDQDSRGRSGRQRVRRRRAARHLRGAAANAAAMAGPVCELLDDGWRVVVVHGNGPQVGNLAIQQEEGAPRCRAMPLFSLVAMTEGQLGSAHRDRSVRRRGRRQSRSPRAQPRDRRPGRPGVRPSDETDRPVPLRGRGACLAQTRGLGHRRGRRPRLPPGRRLTAAAEHRRGRRHALPARRRARRGDRRRRRDPGGRRRRRLDGVDAVIDKDYAAAELAPPTARRGAGARHRGGRGTARLRQADPAPADRGSTPRRPSGTWPPDSSRRAAWAPRSARPPGSCATAARSR